MNHANNINIIEYNIQYFLNNILKLDFLIYNICRILLFTFFAFFHFFLKKVLTTVSICSIIYAQSVVKLIVIYFDGPLAQLAEHLTFNQVVRSSNLRWLTIKWGPLVNRLRHRPFTAEWGVRLSYGSPFKSILLE